MQRAHFDGSSEIGAYVKLTNTYVIVGASHTSQFKRMVEQLVDIPVIETTINSIRTIGCQIQGNKHGLLVPSTTHDHELLFLRQRLPEAVRVRRIDERLNALGNIILCNDHHALVHPEIDPESEEVISHVLGVEVHKMCIGSKPLVGAYGSMNNQGLLVDPETTEEDQMALCEKLGIQVTAGTVNTGNVIIGSGMVVNDCIGFCGKLTTNTELGVMERVFVLREAA